MTHVLFGWNRIFMVRDLTASENDGDESSPIRIEAVPFSEFEGLIESGKLRDSSVIAALYLASGFWKAMDFREIIGEITQQAIPAGMACVHATVRAF